MIKLFIVRHGETEENVAGLLQGHLQGHLTENGKHQAQKLREQLVLKIKPDVIYSSDLQRTIDTAGILNEAFHLPLHLSALLRERDWGEYTGRLIATLPKGEFPPSVESVPDMMVRAREFLQQVYDKYASTGAHILVVSHGVFSRCLQAAAQGKNIWEIPKMQNGEMRPVTLSADLLAPTDKEALSSCQSKDNTDIFKNGKEN